jgi:acetyl esterase
VSALDAGAARALENLAPMAQVNFAELEPEAARGAFAALLGSMQGTPVDAQVEDIPADPDSGRPGLRIYRPLGAQSADARLPAILYFHGGGFVLGGLDLYDVLCSRLAKSCGAVVLSVDYRLAPEHPYPAALADAMAASAWLVDQASRLGVDPTRLCIAGDSAGGNLAAVTCLQLRGEGRQVFAHQLMLYPVMNLDYGKQGLSRCTEGYFLTEEMMRYFADQYLGAVADRQDWRISPLWAPSVDGLPSATVVLCGCDPLYDEGFQYAQRLKDAGGSVSLLTYEAQIHAFVLMDGVIPKAVEAIEEIAATLAKALLPGNG